MKDIFFANIPKLWFGNESFTMKANPVKILYTNLNQ
jgi:hypothetical protein